MWQEKNFAKSAMTSGSIQHSIFCPFLSVLRSPAFLSSLRWCDTVEGTISKDLPISPAHCRKSESVWHVVPGAQDETSCKKIFRRFGLDNALNISAYLLILIFLYFDMFRSILSCVSEVKEENKAAMEGEI
jgi:hypothetical protein